VVDGMAEIGAVSASIAKVLEASAKG
jgi:hypothetical protein